MAKMYRIRVNNPVIGVPISFIQKYCPEQFEIVGLDRYVEDNPYYGKRFTFNNKETYARILIRRKLPPSERLYRVRINNPVIGVPISYIDWHHKDKFELLDRLNPFLQGRKVYQRILIRRYLPPTKRLYHVRINNPVLGVPISYIQKYCPEQFEIVGATTNDSTSGPIIDCGHNEQCIPQCRNHKVPVIGNKPLYKRIFIRHKHPVTGEEE